MNRAYQYIVNTLTITCYISTLVQFVTQLHWVALTIQTSGQFEVKDSPWGCRIRCSLQTLIEDYILSQELRHLCSQSLVLNSICSLLTWCVIYDIWLVGIIHITLATHCYVCDGESCLDPWKNVEDADQYKQDCNDFGFIEDGGCSKRKYYDAESKVYTGKLLSCVPYTH